MIDAILYPTIYLIIISLLTLFQCTGKGYFLYRNDNHTGEICLLILLIVFIGFRPASYVFVDMMNYIGFYNHLKGTPFNFNPNAENKIFDNLFSYLAAYNMGYTTFFIVIAAIYFSGIYICCRKLFPKNTFLAFLVYLGAFSTLSYATNGVKAGAAASIFLMALAYREKKWLSVLLLLISWGFHHSMILCIAAYVVVSVYKNPKAYLLFWVGCLLIALLHIGFFQELFAGMADERGAAYLTSTKNWGGKSGFRYDFVLYSATPVAVGWWVIFKKRIISDRYNFLLNLYLLTNGIWMLCMYASFTNRIAYLSWFMLPIVLIYPFINEKISDWQNEYLSRIALAHLSFTLFMAFIYYS